ncbi:hypothetical protein QR680_016869 [Steinernema hermaphroditum]|uniref:Galectin n=1 Tax=Steinernema hermaphroditum TaxID=289476 RepID=A0AA39HCJ2_9BILA|nr:hypothetical protein QR680_016869 [Steinernema hermaphroditum]
MELGATLLLLVFLPLTDAVVFEKDPFSNKNYYVGSINESKPLMPLSIQLRRPIIPGSVMVVEGRVYWNREFAFAFGNDRVLLTMPFDEPKRPPKEIFHFRFLEDGVQVFRNYMRTHNSMTLKIYAIEKIIIEGIFVPTRIEFTEYTLDSKTSQDVDISKDGRIRLLGLIKGDFEVSFTLRKISQSMKAMFSTRKV